MAVEDSLDIFSPDPLGRDYLYGLSTGQERLGLQPPPQGLQLDTRPYDQMQATPRGFISGLFSDVLGGTFNMPQMPRTGIPAVDVFSPNMNLFNRLAFGDVQKTAERISYGEPLTTGQGMTLKPREETIGAALTVAPFAGEAARLGVRAGRAGARMVGQEIADRVSTGQAILPSGFAEPRSSLFAVEPSPMMPKPQAPVSELGFYSAAEQAALNLPRNKGTGQSFLNDLMKAPDVKKDELAWTGLDDFLKDKPNVTKQEVQDFIANNKVDLQEVTMGAPVAEDPIGIAKRKAIFDKYEPEIQGLYKEMDNPRYRLVNRGMGAEEYNRGVVLQNRGYRGEPLTAQEQSELDGILSRLDGNTVKEFANAEEARSVYLAMSPEERLQHSIRPVKNSTELQQEINLLQVRRDAEANRAYVVPEESPTRYQKYQLAGGENYREILLKIPENMSEYNKYTESLRAKYGQGGFANLPLTDIERARLEKFYANEDVKPYKTTHWQDPNILAHMRVNDRIDADGKKMLLVEEIQSDWHQAGREKGYKGQTRSIQQIDKDLDSVVNELRSKPNVNYVPAAPFKDTWYQLALKRVMKYAADNGYERVGLTTGEQQAKRYDLSKQVDELLYKKNADGTYQLSAQANGRGNMLGESIPENKLSDYVGKEVATKIAENSGRELNLGANNQPKDMWKGLSGIDLKVGGEGMKKYYDEIYPKFLEKYGKKWDAGVGETKIITEDNAWNMAEQIKQRGISDAQWRALSEEDKLKLWNDIKQSVGRKQEPIRYIDITPKMKESVGKGQPLFTAIPAGTLGLGGLEYADPFASPLTEDTTR